MSDNLSYIKELGIGTSSEGDTEAQTEDPKIESKEDLSLDSGETPEAKKDADTEQPNEYLDSLKAQIEGMEKRIKDKDDYINELREDSKQKSVEEEGDTEESEEDDFWADPESKIKKLEDTIKVQQLQIQETMYANTVENYWGTVKQDALQEAVATDADFANQFNASAEPYKVAYEYLKNKQTAKVASENELREQIKRELLEEMNANKEVKQAPPSLSSTGGKSTESSSKANEDGFASVFKI